MDISIWFESEVIAWRRVARSVAIDRFSRLRLEFFSLPGGLKIFSSLAMSRILSFINKAPRICNFVSLSYKIQYFDTGLETQKKQGKTVAGFLQNFETCLPLVSQQTSINNTKYSIYSRQK
jgi:hypothetical protein